jgi:hypothetical protein
MKDKWFGRLVGYFDLGDLFDQMSCCTFNQKGQTIFLINITMA